jgi:hypothetical protein
MAATHENIPFGTNEVRELFATTVIAATIIEIDRANNCADIETDAYGRINDVPFFYHCEAAETVDDGHLAFNDDDEVWVLAKNAANSIGVPSTLYIVTHADGPKPCLSLLLQPNVHPAGLYYMRLPARELEAVAETGLSLSYNYLNPKIGTTTPATDADSTVTQTIQAQSCPKVFLVVQQYGYLGQTWASLKVVDYQDNPAGNTVITWSNPGSKAREMGGIISPDGNKVAAWAMASVRVFGPYYVYFYYRRWSRPDKDSAFVLEKNLSQFIDVLFPADDPGGDPDAGYWSHPNAVIHWWFGPLNRWDGEDLPGSRNQTTTQSARWPGAGFCIDFDCNLYVSAQIKRVACNYPCAGYYFANYNDTTYYNVISRINVENWATDGEHHYIAETEGYQYLAWDVAADALRYTPRHDPDTLSKMHNVPYRQRYTALGGLCSPVWQGLDPDPYAAHRKMYQLQNARNPRDMVFYQPGAGFAVQTGYIPADDPAEVRLSVAVNGAETVMDTIDDNDDAHKIIRSRHAILLNCGAIFGEMIEIDGVKQLNYLVHASLATGTLTDLEPQWIAQSAGAQVNPLISLDIEVA